MPPLHSETKQPSGLEPMLGQDHQLAYQRNIQAYLEQAQDTSLDVPHRLNAIRYITDLHSIAAARSPETAQSFFDILFQLSFDPDGTVAFRSAIYAAQILSPEKNSPLAEILYEMESNKIEPSSARGLDLATLSDQEIELILNTAVRFKKALMLTFIHIYSKEHNYSPSPQLQTIAETLFSPPLAELLTQLEDQPRRSQAISLKEELIYTLDALTRTYLHTDLFPIFFDKLNELAQDETPRIATDATLKAFALDLENRTPTQIDSADET